MASKEWHQKNGIKRIAGDKCVNVVFDVIVNESIENSTKILKEGKVLGRAYFDPFLK